MWCSLYNVKKWRKNRIDGPIDSNQNVPVDFSINIRHINANAFEGSDPLGGDMILTQSQIAGIKKNLELVSNDSSREKRHAVVYKDCTWSNGVNYYFESKPSEKLKAAFDKAVEAWSKNTCIDFKKDASAHDRVRISTKRNGCESQVGKIGGEQFLYLGRGCDTFDNVAHELGHTLGLLHTMNRHDRDEYITMQEWNIKPGLHNEYIIIPIANNENYGMEYDYGSIMQYKWKSASTNRLPTMIPKDLNYNSTMGSEMISFVDLYVLNRHYKCEGKLL
ncbi:astacin [Ancylostoma caninum]|uniref:Metalloendopeptidase n=1 Tax=Ancylostoma caninum TaxID=29170 RepID=A0A368GSZ7_ANCCA|nr:astacin [Ancylostoma caninum]